MDPFSVGYVECLVLCVVRIGWCMYVFTWWVGGVYCVCFCFF